jgi:hypothetical protein
MSLCQGVLKVWLQNLGFHKEIGKCGVWSEEFAARTECVNIDSDS